MRVVTNHVKLDTLRLKKGRTARRGVYNHGCAENAGLRRIHIKKRPEMSPEFATTSPPKECSVSREGDGAKVCEIDWVGRSFGSAVLIVE